MPPTAKLRAVMFDLDGTLADTLDDIADAVNATIAGAGYPVHPADSYRTMVGEGFALLVRRALPPETELSGQAFDALHSEAVEIYGRHFMDRTKPYEGVEEMLDVFSRLGVPCAVLSNKPDRLAASLVSALFPGRSFIDVRGERKGVPRKPDPSSALDIAARAGIPPAEWLYVGDSGVDMRTARAAGMQPCGALWGFRSRSELLDAGAATLAKNPSGVMAAFGIVG